MTYCNIIAAVIAVSLIVISSAAPLISSQPQQQQLQQRPSSQLSNEFINSDLFADYNRFLMKSKKWSPSAAAAFGDEMPSSSDPKWAHARSFFPDKRMDDNLDYPNLNSGRLEWNFNRL